MEWVVQRRAGQLLAFVNNTGFDAQDVELRLEGQGVGGDNRRRDWSTKVPVVRDGDSVEAPFLKSWGWRHDPPRIVVTWMSPDCVQRQQVLDRLPL